MFKPKMYGTIDEIPTSVWLVRSPVYKSAEDAKHAAAKVFFESTGAIVKKCNDGYIVYHWVKDETSST